MEEYIGIVRPFVGNYAPINWKPCDGRKLPIYQYEALYSIIGTTYGGDGMTDFALPDLRGRAVVGQGQGPGLTKRIVGEYGGSENDAINLNTLAKHTHTYNALSTAANSATPENCFLTTTAINRYCIKDATDTEVAMNTEVISTTPGGSEPHENMPPFLVTNYIICCEGIYPPRD